MDQSNKRNLKIIMAIDSGKCNGDPRTYQDLVKGRFEINVKRIERISNIDNDISSKLFDYSADTIKQLKRDGYDDVQRYFNEIK